LTEPLSRNGCTRYSIYLDGAVRKPRSGINIRLKLTGSVILNNLEFDGKFIIHVMQKNEGDLQKTTFQLNNMFNYHNFKASATKS
jgi:hypothetical protein